MNVLSQIKSLAFINLNKNTNLTIMASDLTFHMVDYIVLGIFLLLSSIIGIYFGFFKVQKTTDDYLVGGRQLHLLPVSLSLLVTYQSAISILGVPAEVYIYNTMFLWMFIAIMLANTFQALAIVPLVVPLKLTSTYEYLGQRFNSRSVQLFGTVIGMLQTLLYMAVVLLAPSLALEAVAGIPLWLSVVVVGIVGTLYTAVGGFRTVIWTDVFQFVILFAGMIVVLILGTMHIGGVNKLIEVAKAGDRVKFGETSPDPRVRHTVWSLLIGGFFNWLPNCCNQSAVQRMCSMKSVRDSRISTLLNVPMVFVWGGLLTVIGMLLFSYFSIDRCDPWSAGYVQNANQLVPYFVMHVFSSVPGLPGLFIAALFSGALSSLSSGINSMSANTIQDILVNVLKHSSEFRKTLVAKLVVILYGCLAVCLAYIGRALTGTVTQIALTAMGATGGPMVGMMFLGAIFPQANWIGALIGGILGVGINIWIALSSILYGWKAPHSVKVPIDGCMSTTTITTSTWSYNETMGSSTSLFMDTTENTLSNLLNETTTMSSITDNNYIALYDVSYLYFGLIGFLLTFIIGLIVSLVTGMDRGEPTESRYLFPCVRKFWRLGRNVLVTPPIYTAVKVKKRKRSNEFDHISYNTRIKSLDLTWYNKQPEDQL